MLLTPYHTKYYAYEITRRYPSDSSQKLTTALMDAQVDLNPHQIDAALFAFQSPLSKGVILADEVGLGKTIEAGLVISQKWAERKRKILIIVPSSLRKQWNQELQDKFFLPSIILETKSYNQYKKSGITFPFEQKNNIVICSYNFCKQKASDIKKVEWDIVIIDEAHRLRNVYRTDNKIGKTIKEALTDRPKVLMTATPLQNSLLELYGLVSIIDDYTFGELKSFKSQFVRLTEEGNFNDLKERLSTICKRTLRKQVQEYVPYTKRSAITIEFTPSTPEQLLYEKVTEYLQKELLFALPAGQRHLMTLILRKLLASSTFAIAGTLDSLINKLNKAIDESELISAEEVVGEDFEGYQDMKEEWTEDSEEDDNGKLSEGDIEEIKKEIEYLEKYRDLAVSITNNAKGEKLLTALKEGFSKATSLGSKEKAIIFTESTRTQNYIFRLLNTTDYKDKIVLFNGSNNDEKSKKIYKSWIEKHKDTDRISGSKTADMRAALVDYFREEAKIMIATEAAAEGINLQFCSLVVNYDLPWNPQRIEQRIGRCHRYGQKFDVVVVNFLNTKNAADKRVYELLDEKFKLFDGVFGASDEVLGSIESGIDFEKRIAEIYQKCRNEEEIQRSFDELRDELDEKIKERIISTHQKLLNNFDIEVTEKLKKHDTDTKKYLTNYESFLWNICLQYLENHAQFDDEKFKFTLKTNPFPDTDIPNGPYKLGRNVSDAHILRPGHALTVKILDTVKSNKLSESKIKFDLTNQRPKISILEDLKVKSGYLYAENISIDTFESTDYMVLAGICSDGEELTEDQCQRLFSLSGEVKNGFKILDSDKKKLDKLVQKKKSQMMDIVKAKDNSYFLKEVDKLSKWADDKQLAAETEMKETKNRIKELNRLSKTVSDPAEQLKIQKELQELAQKQRKQRQQIFIVEDQIEAERKKMVDSIEIRMKQKITEDKLFLIRWELV